MLGIDIPLGIAAAGEFGLAAVLGRETEFEAAVERCLAWLAA
jgi:hypothetical protein